MASEAEITRHMAALRQEIKDHSRVFLAAAALAARWKAGVTNAVSPQEFGEELMRALEGRPLPTADPTSMDPDDQPGPENRALAKVANAAGEVRSWAWASGGGDYNLIGDAFSRLEDAIKEAMRS